jgi:hypothetical protein
VQQGLEEVVQAPTGFCLALLHRANFGDAGGDRALEGKGRGIHPNRSDLVQI